MPNGIQSGQTFAVELPSPEPEQGQRDHTSADENDTVELEVMCPLQCAEGDEFDLETEYGEFPVRVPAGIEPGEEFVVCISVSELRSPRQSSELRSPRQSSELKNPRQSDAESSASRSERNWSAESETDAILTEDTPLGTHIPMASITRIRSALGRTDAQARLVREACSLIGCDRASIFLRDAKTHELVIHGSAQVGRHRQQRPAWALGLRQPFCC